MTRKTFSQDASWSCPCGVVAERPYGMCRKCYSGMTWRKRTAGSAGKPSRRRRGRLSRDRARLIAAAATSNRADL